MTGGCLCRAVPYRLLAAPADAGWCHCRNCQLNSGSPAMAFASIAIEHMAIEAGEEAIRSFASSDESERCFCGICGTPLWVQDRVDPDRRDFNLATLDDPAAVTPGFHIYYASHIPWAEAADDLPRHEGRRI